ncbi:unnamed protein product [Schistocephalus solidus]|uniref:DM domain-containing protein n=1 Tax=Schistocephalus solidus TaxID=70667 RepID=A0A183SXK7_SCHSO|nr:unnamed protein product [Schistocephalus solidus]
MDPLEQGLAGAGVVFAPVNAARSSYMCRKCRAHGRLVPVRQHKRNCPYKHCNCSVCSLVNYGRHIVAKQIALAVDGKRRGSDGKEPPKATAMVEEEGPHCRRCRNHGKTNPWKGHKKVCPFYYCICQQCILITLRKSNEKNLLEVKVDLRCNYHTLSLPLPLPLCPVSRQGQEVRMQGRAQVAGAA